MDGSFYIPFLSALLNTWNENRDIYNKILLFTQSGVTVSFSPVSFFPGEKNDRSVFSPGERFD